MGSEALPAACRRRRWRRQAISDWLYTAWRSALRLAFYRPMSRQDLLVVGYTLECGWAVVR